MTVVRGHCHCEAEGRGNLVFWTTFFLCGLCASAVRLLSPPASLEAQRTQRGAGFMLSAERAESIKAPACGSITISLCGLCAFAVNFLLLLAEIASLRSQ
jgi:hypothetical protein